MFASTQLAPLVMHPRSSASGDDALDGPPVQRLTARQIRSVSATWRARGRAGDATALRVAEALEWVANRRASEEVKPLKVLAGRISAWMGLGDSARTH